MNLTPSGNCLGEFEVEELTSFKRTIPDDVRYPNRCDFEGAKFAHRDRSAAKLLSGFGVHLASDQEWRDCGDFFRLLSLRQTKSDVW